MWTGQGEGSHLASLLREVDGCLLFPEGRDRIWPGVLLAWLGAQGLPADSPVAGPVLHPHPRGGAHPRKAHGGGQPWGPPARPAAHYLAPTRPAQGSPGLGQTVLWTAAEASLPACLGGHWLPAENKGCSDPPGFCPGREALVEGGGPLAWDPAHPPVRHPTPPLPQQPTPLSRVKPGPGHPRVASECFAFVSLTMVPPVGSPVPSMPRDPINSVFPTGLAVCGHLPAQWGLGVIPLPPHSRMLVLARAAWLWQP